MPTTFEMIGHAGLVVRQNGFSLVLDPWLGDSSAGGLYHAHPPVMAPPALEEADAIHISHIHRDHFCPGSLSRFSRETPVYIAKFKDKRFLKAVQDVGFTNVVEVPLVPEFVSCGPFRLSSLYVGDGDAAFNSSVILESEDRYYLLNNDSELPDVYYAFMRMFVGRFTGCFVAYSGFSPFPVCYDFSRCESMKEPMPTSALLERENARLSQRIREITGALEPDWVVPYASGIRFLNRDMIDLNEQFAPRESLEKIDTSPARRIVMWPGDTVDETGALKTGTGRRCNKIHETEVLPELFPIQETVADVEERRGLFERAVLELATQASLEWATPLDVAFRIKATDGDWMLNVRMEGRSSHVLADDAKTSMTIAYSAGAVSRILRGEARFRDVHWSYGFRATVHDFRPPVRRYQVQNW